METADIRILDALQKDGRLTNAELAERVGLSPSQCSRRRAALEHDGLIERYQALLNAQALGLSLIAFVEVTLHAHSESRARAFAQFLESLAEVQEAYTLTGETDYLLKLRVSDLDALAKTLNTRILAHESVARIRSSVVLEKLKETNHLPIRGS